MVEVQYDNFTSHSTHSACWDTSILSSCLEDSEPELEEDGINSTVSIMTTTVHGLTSPSTQLARCTLASSIEEIQEEAEHEHEDYENVIANKSFEFSRLLHGPGSSDLLFSSVKRRSSSMSSEIASPLPAAKRSIFLSPAPSSTAIPSSPTIPSSKSVNKLLSTLSPAPHVDITNNNKDNQKTNIISKSKFAHWNRQHMIYTPMQMPLTQSIPLPKMRRATTDCNNNTFARHIGGEISDLLTSNIGVAPILPCFDSPRDAIKRITPTIMTGLLRGDFSDSYSKVIIVDCRYPYEYEGGHLPGAVNVSSFEVIDKLLFQECDLGISHCTIVIFHCEFSSERAPRMALHVRNLDRVLNAEVYPRLHYPQLYILDGGYKNFYIEYPECCDPPNQYVPMRNAGYREELRFHQRLKYHDGNSHGKHRHKLRSCSLRKSHSIAMPMPVSGISSFLRQRGDVSANNDPRCVVDMLSSDIGDIYDQGEEVMQAAERVLLVNVEDGRVSK